MTSPLPCLHANIRPDGQPWVMTFGLAKRDGHAITMIVEGQVPGARHCLPPCGGGRRIGVSDDARKVRDPMPGNAASPHPAPLRHSDRTDPPCLRVGFYCLPPLWTIEYRE